MRRLLCAYLSISLSILTIPSVAFAEDPPPKPADCTEAISLTTPCSGVLLPPGAAADGLRCIRLDLPKLKLDLTLSTKLHEQERLHFDNLLFLERDRNKQLSEQVNVLLQVDRTPKWYNSPYLWAGVGLVVGAGLAIGMAHALPDR